MEFLKVLNVLLHFESNFTGRYTKWQKNLNPREFFND